MISQPEKFFTPEQISSLLQVNIVTVRRWLNSGRLQGYHLGKKIWRISQSQLTDFLSFEYDTGAKKLNNKWGGR